LDGNFVLLQSSHSFATPAEPPHAHLRCNPPNGAGVKHEGGAAFV
jgi:hypothetical protein